jgi:hypothetical protein
MTNSVMWRTDTDSGVCLERTDEGVLILGLESDNAPLTIHDAAHLVEVLSAELSSEAQRYLRAARAADQTRPDIDDAFQTTLEAKDRFATRHSAEPAYTKSRTALWALLQVGDDEPLPAQTVRACCPGRTCNPTTIQLSYERGDLWSYRRVGNREVFFCPATLDQLRERLKDTTWMP